MLSKFFKSRWDEQVIVNKLEEALLILQSHKQIDDKKINKLRTEAKKLLNL